MVSQAGLSLGPLASSLTAAGGSFGCLGRSRSRWSRRSRRRDDQEQEEQEKDNQEQEEQEKNNQNQDEPENYHLEHPTSSRDAGSCVEHCVRGGEQETVQEADLEEGQEQRQVGDTLVSSTSAVSQNSVAVTQAGDSWGSRSPHEQTEC